MPPESESAGRGVRGRYRGDAPITYKIVPDTILYYIHPRGSDDVPRLQGSRKRRQKRVSRLSFRPPRAGPRLSTVFFAGAVEHPGFYMRAYIHTQHTHTQTCHILEQSRSKHRSLLSDAGRGAFSINVSSCCLIFFSLLPTGV